MQGCLRIVRRGDFMLVKLELMSIEEVEEVVCAELHSS
jgi:hypothetical protein